MSYQRLWVHLCFILTISADGSVLLSDSFAVMMRDVYLCQCRFENSETR